MKPVMKKPNIFRRTVMFIVDSWRGVMDVRYNPLKYIPDPSLQTYFMLVLFTVWSVTFGFIAIFWLGFIEYSILASILIHSAVLIPIAFTNAVFVDAERDGENWLKEWREEQSRYKLVVNRLKTKNLILWDPNKEA
jgi:hypothetical protein|tara:strand:+ start:236 stop:643 length:408 start_codon:yes stop_codon:yes gene_type:complete